MGARMRPAGRGSSARIPSHVQEEFDGKFHGLQIAHVHDPEAGRSVFVGEVHLLPDFGDWNGVEPLIRARPAYIVEVVIDTGSAAAVASVVGSRASCPNC